MSASFYVNMGQLTSAKTAPYLIVLSTVCSIGPLISGEYSSSNPSSSWSDERRASTYTKNISGLGCAVAKARTVLFAENLIFKEPLCFPMTIASVLFYQLCADQLLIID